MEKNKLMVKGPAWYSKIDIKPYYENERAKLYWDIPEYYGNEDEDGERILRPDGKIILEEKKEMYVLEMSVPWMDNRDRKFTEKEAKYVDIVQRLKIDHLEYNVKQLTFVLQGVFYILQCLNFYCMKSFCPFFTATSGINL